MKKLRLLFICGMCTCFFMVGMAQNSKLRFRSDKTFKIVQFTDVHLVPGNQASNEAAERMNEVLDAEKPDLVIYTGDVVYGKPAAQGFDAALQPVVSRHIPFAVTLGNHDDEQDMTREQILEYIKKFPGNLTSTVKGLSGVTNFILSISSSEGKKDASILYCFDSHSYSTMKTIKGYDWLGMDQVNWYRKESTDYTKKNGGIPIPSLAFFHIPLPEYNLAATDENTTLIGTRREKACSSALNTGMFAAMLESGDVMATFVGHDHVNDYVAYWKGILLTYGRFTGGKTVYCDIPGGNGARIILLKEGQRSFDTWERLSNGRVINKLTYPDDFVKHNN